MLLVNNARGGVILMVVVDAVVIGTGAQTSTGTSIEPLPEKFKTDFVPNTCHCRVVQTSSQELGSPDLLLVAVTSTALIKADGIRDINSVENYYRRIILRENGSITVHGTERPVTYVAQKNEKGELELVIVH
jgi:hypothetical protein